MIDTRIILGVQIIYNPPYNTGKDFVYPDNYHDSIENYKAITGQTDEEGNRISTNTEASGRFHTDWLNMMYPRLRLARNLLSDDGIIFISIGHEEEKNLIEMANEIYGENNQIGIVSRVTKTASNNGTHFAPTIDYLICYAKNITNIDKFRDKVDDSLYKKIETCGERKGERYRDDVALYQAALNDLRPNQKYFITCPDGSKVIPPCSQLDEIMREGDGRWRWSKEKYLASQDLLVFKRTDRSPLLDKNGNQAKYNVYTKSYLSEREECGTLPRELWQDFINRKGADYLKKLDIPFDFSKPYELIEYIMDISSTNNDSIILDFFSGSATTADAVMRKNYIDGGNRRFICVQLPEPTQEDSEAFKAGYKNICEIGKERIRRAGEKIKEEVENGNSQLKIDEEPKKVPDIGFKVFKLDSSNLKKWNPDFENLEATLDDYINNYVPDRTEEDVVYEFMLKMGLDLSYPIDVTEIDGKKVYSIGFGALMMCLDDNITVSVAEGMVKLYKEQAPETWKVVFKDNGFVDDCTKTNVKLTLIQAGLEEDAFTTV